MAEGHCWIAWPCESNSALSYRLLWSRIHSLRPGSELQLEWGLGGGPAQLALGLSLRSEFSSGPGVSQSQGCGQSMVTHSAKVRVQPGIRDQSRIRAEPGLRAQSRIRAQSGSGLGPRSGLSPGSWLSLGSGLNLALGLSLRSGLSPGSGLRLGSGFGLGSGLRAGLRFSPGSGLSAGSGTISRSRLSIRTHSMSL